MATTPFVDVRRVGQLSKQVGTVGNSRTSQTSPVQPIQKATAPLIGGAANKTPAITPISNELLTSLLTRASQLRTRHHLTQARNAIAEFTEKLSSGKKINHAKDGAARQSIANRLTASINGLNQAYLNAQTGQSLMRTVEGAVNQINDSLQSMRTLNVKAANGTLSEGDLESIQDEIAQHLEHIDTITINTKFNGLEVFSGEFDDIEIQLGAHDNQTITLKLSKLNTDGLQLTGLTVTQDQATPQPIEKIDLAIEKVSQTRGQLGALESRLDSAIANIQSTLRNLVASRSNILDTDYATATSKLSQALIKQNASIAVLAHANQSQQSVSPLLS